MADEKRKIQTSIPASKVRRVAKFATTGVKVGGNYIKHYAKKTFNPNISRDELDKDNAKDIYESLSELKGSALKVAQMMSMDKNILPQAYSDQFKMAQYSAPPLSYPLVMRTFKKYFAKSPTEMFDTFTKDAINAASIGQVHQATLDGKKLAVKVQYPGVAESVSSDLKLVKPIAVNMLGLNQQDVNHYTEEVEKMMLSETDYGLELKNSIEIPKACADLDNLFFPTYYPEYSSEKVLTMDWLEGKHLDAFMETNPSQEIRNQIGQALWNFYDFQIHKLLQVHADPHPGNFLLTEDGKVGIIDFGCVKVIEQDFYDKYFVLLDKDLLNNEVQLLEKLMGFNFLYADDKEEDKKVLFGIFQAILEMLSRPFHGEEFDFGDDSYFKELSDFGEIHKDTPQLRKSKRPRGTKDALYINRSYFGLYNILNHLGAKVNTSSRWSENKEKMKKS
ncbi:MAG: putative unusual protein kinase regulating ubiquinone biosynthesis (AarF/ABC1/UbiB family) [Arenicella sp.]|jgi:predicted unusual protein kinase regulating ubiquinone biosynthesis (AarF/ABC1/UbiB family)